MFKKPIIFLSMIFLSSSIAKADSIQSVDVLNDSAQIMKWSANNADNSFIVSQVVPAYSKAFVIAQVTQLNTLQDKLFAGIFRNSPEEIRQAITAGANVNKPREGRTPLTWALAFNLVNAAACLLQYGAR